MPPSLKPHELSLLREVRTSDEDHGGLSGEELTAEELDVMARLVDAGYVEAVGEYGEAPDGEEDEADAGDHDVVYRVTGRGVLALRDAGEV